MFQYKIKNTGNMTDNKKRIEKWRDIIGIDTIIRWIKDKRLSLSPDFQRNYVWDIEKASGLIESLLLSIPVPTIFIFDNGENDKIVIDGKQRLTTIYKFIEEQTFESNGKDGTFTLHLKDKNDKDKDVARINDDGTNWDGKSWDDLTKKEKNHILDTKLEVIMIDGEQDFIFSIFERLNTGGETLNDMEIRACLYRGKLLTDLNKLTEYAECKTFLEKFCDMRGDKVKRLENLELMLKIVAFAKDWSDYKPTLKKFLNSFCKNNKDESFLNVFDALKALMIDANFISYLDNIPDEFRDKNKNKNPMSSL